MYCAHDMGYLQTNYYQQKSTFKRKDVVLACDFYFDMNTGTIRYNGDEWIVSLRNTPQEVEFWKSTRQCLYVIM